MPRDLYEHLLDVTIHTGLVWSSVSGVLAGIAAAEIVNTAVGIAEQLGSGPLAP